MKVPIQGISQQDGYSWDDDDTEVENLEITEIMENLSLEEKETDFSLSRKLSRSGKRERNSFLKRLRLRFSNFLISKKFTRRKIIIMSTTLSLEIVLFIILGRSLSRVSRALKVSLRALKVSIENALPLIPLLSYNRTVQLVNYFWSEIIFKALNKEFIRINKHLRIQNYFRNLASLDCIVAHNKILIKEFKSMYLVANTRQLTIWSPIPGLLSYEASSLLMLKRKERLKNIFVSEIACYALREMLALYPASKTVALLKYVSTINPTSSK